MNFAVKTCRFVGNQGTVINAPVGIVQKLLTIVAEGLSISVAAPAVDPDHNLEGLLLSHDPRRLPVPLHLNSLHL